MDCWWYDATDRKCTVTDLPCTVDGDRPCNLSDAIAEKFAEHYET